MAGMSGMSLLSKQSERSSSRADQTGLSQSSAHITTSRSDMVFYMTSPSAMSRRTFIALSGAIPVALSAPAKKIPIGLELYSVRDELAKDLVGTVRAVAKMGYEVVEFFSPYYGWPIAYALDVRTLMDDLGIRCNSTHNGANAFTADGLKKAIELNHILGSQFIVLASAGKVTGLDGWKSVADRLS